MAVVNLLVVKTMNMRGTVNNFLAGKGYGFIDGDDGKSYFFHIKDFVSPLPDTLIEEGGVVEFDPTPSPRFCLKISLVGNGLCTPGIPWP